MRLPAMRRLFASTCPLSVVGTRMCTNVTGSSLLPPPAQAHIHKCNKLEEEAKEKDTAVGSLEIQLRRERQAHKEATSDLVKRQDELTKRNSRLEGERKQLEQKLRMRERDADELRGRLGSALSGRAGSGGGAPTGSASSWGTGHTTARASLQGLRGQQQPPDEEGTGVGSPDGKAHTGGSSWGSAGSGSQNQRVSSRTAAINNAAALSAARREAENLRVSDGVGM